MESKVSEFVDLFPDFHTFDPTDQLVRLVYFYTDVQNHGTINQEELVTLFNFASIPAPKNLRHLLAYLCGKGGRLVQQDGEYKLRHEIRKLVGAEVRAAHKIGPSLRIKLAWP
jgi:hypothetical protein